MGWNDAVGGQLHGRPSCFYTKCRLCVKRHFEPRRHLEFKELLLTKLASLKTLSKEFTWCILRFAESTAFTSLCFDTEGHQSVQTQDYWDPYGSQVSSNPSTPKTELNPTELRGAGRYYFACVS